MSFATNTQLWVSGAVERHRRNKVPVLAAFAAVLVGGSTAAYAGDPLIDFEDEDLAPGTSVEGPGTVHPDLDIQRLDSGTDTAVIIATGSNNPLVYTAPNETGSRSNNCLEDATGTRVVVNSSTASAKGFARQGNRARDFAFTFGGLKVASFSIRVLDIGDFNPNRQSFHEYTLTGEHDTGFVTDVLSYESEGTVNPRSSDLGNLFLTGDACSAENDQPGYRTFSVQFPGGIHTVTFEYTAGNGGFDPNVGFDSIDFTLLLGIDIKPGSDPNCFRVDGNGVIPVAINGSDPFDVVDVDVSSLDFAGLDVRVKGDGEPQCAFEDWNQDTYTDLVCQFADDDPRAWTPEDGTAKLSGFLVDGTPFEGTDAICLR